MLTDSSQKTDQELVTACLHGDETAWDALIDRYSRLIYSIPLRFGLQAMVADEIFQEVCLTLLDKLDSLHSVARLSAWITTVTKRTSINYMRLQKPESVLEDDQLADDSVPLERDLMEMEQATAVRVAVAQMDERCRHLLDALFLQHESATYDDLSEKLSIPKGSIGPTRNRCLQKLRDRILRHYD